MRRQPVAFFLGDAAFLSDSKFRLLARRLTDPDDFNSAVGAYFIALAAARRNGLPCLDLCLETQSSFLSQLIDVGLLVADGFPDKPFREWAPSRPKYPSDTKSTAAPNAPNDPEVSEPSVSSASALPTPSPLPSPPITSTSEGVQGVDGLPHLDSAVSTTWEQATGRTVLASGEWVLNYLDDACRRHSITNVCVAILHARKQFDHIPDGPPLVAAVRRLLDPMPDGKATAAKEREAEDKRASDARRAATLRRTHALGAHAADPHPQCPSCREGDAA